MHSVRHAGWSHDQAAGLRRLFATTSAHTVAFFGGHAGVGTTRIVAQVAAALAHDDKLVLAIDECGGNCGLVTALGLASRFDFAQVLEQHLGLSQVVLTASETLSVLPAWRAAQASGSLNRSQLHAWNDYMPVLRRARDFVLVDAAAPTGARRHVSPLVASAHHWVVVAAAGSAAITDSYALVKRLVAAAGPRRLVVILTRTRDDGEAWSVFENLRRVARQHLGVQLDLLGTVPFDSRWQRSPGVLSHAADDCAATQACRRIAGALARMPGGEGRAHDARPETPPRQMCAPLAVGLAA
jgi:flagellar biosynthesis protein FlhG